MDREANYTTGPYSRDSIQGMELARQQGVQQRLSGLVGSANQIAREPTVSEQILTRTQQINCALQEIEKRAETLVGRLGLPTGGETGDKTRPCRGGVLGQIEDSLDQMNAPLGRITSHLEMIARQV
jgi:hypothetical protein